MADERVYSRFCDRWCLHAQGIADQIAPHLFQPFGVNVDGGQVGFDGNAQGNAALFCLVAIGRGDPVE